MGKLKTHRTQTPFERRSAVSEMLYTASLLLHGNCFIETKIVCAQWVHNIQTGRLQTRQICISSKNDFMTQCMLQYQYLQCCWSWMHDQFLVSLFI